MRRLFKLFIFVLLFIGVGFYSVNAESNVTINTHSPNAGTTICVKSSRLGETPYIYGWFKYDGSNNAIANWPGKFMLPDTPGSGIYCYTVAEGEKFDKVIFNNGTNNIQTIDLSTIKDSADIINKYLYTFEDTMIGLKYKGEWYVYDLSGLNNLIDQGNGIINNRLTYTKNSYNNFISKYNEANGVVNYPNPISGDSPHLIYSNDVGGSAVYTSPYIDIYNQLVDAIDALQNRISIVFKDNIEGGEVSAYYVDDSDNPNNEVEINTPADNGYEVSTVKAYKVIDNIDSNMVLGDELEVTTRNNKYYTEFSDETVSGAQGVYVDAIFKKKVYRIVFTVDRYGKIIDEDSGNEIDVNDVIEVEHGSNFLAKLIANDGYELKSATVNGTDANIVNNILKLEDIQANQNVVISFTIKNFIIKIDDVDYTFAYGTTYDEIISKIDTNREGYTFDGLVDSNKNKITDKYIVKHNDTLYTIFKDNNDGNIVNPETGFKLLRVLLLSVIVSSLLYLNGSFVKKNR